MTGTGKEHRGAQFKAWCDFLELLYCVPFNLFETLSAYEKGDSIDLWGEGFYLYVTEGRRKTDTPPKRIAANLLGNDNKLIGELIFYPNEGESKNGRCYAKVDNEALYSKETFSYIIFAAEAMGLRLSAIKRCDIALDCPKNLTKVIRGLIKCPDYSVIIKGKNVKDKTLLQGYTETAQRTRQRVQYDHATISIKTDHKDIELCIYDKKQELKQQSSYKKTYIPTFSTGHFRAEARINSAAFCQFWSENLAYTYTNFNDAPDLHAFVNMLQDDFFKIAMWSYYTDKMIYFRSKRTGKKVTITEVIDGNY